MPDDLFICQCIHNTLEGLRDGLSHYSGASRAAVIYAIKADDPIRVFDPQQLLRGHEPKFKELYLDSDTWRREGPDTKTMQRLGQMYPEPNLQLAGLISCGGRSRNVFYQMWFTEHHPDMCAIGPTERWLEHAAWLLSNDCASKTDHFMGTSGYVLREYSTHAVRDFIIDEINIRLGWDTTIRVYPILDAILGISKTREEGAWPRGELVFAEPKSIAGMTLLTRFPENEQPHMENFKHVRKLLLAVENSRRKLISNGKTILGISDNIIPPFCIIADFAGGHGFLRINGDLLCSFSDGSFHSTTRRAKLVHLEEILLEADLDPALQSDLFKTVTRLVHTAEDQKYGCTLVIDLNQRPLEIAGQHLEIPLDLRKADIIALAESLAKVDGALHIGADTHLHGFACLLDGRAVTGEDRARGARFNSALRFTAERNNLLVIVVSEDRPVSIIQDGVEITAKSYWDPVSSCTILPPTLKEWIEDQDSG